MKLILAMLPTILLTAYSQLVIKWRVSTLAVADNSASGLARAARYLGDLYVISAVFVSLLSAVAWFYVVERYPVSLAFPAYVGVLFAIVTIGGAVLLKEVPTAQHLVGVAIILLGVLVVSRAA
jgi:multidrug transporter EmrE-like cation transporter